MNRGGRFLMSSLAGTSLTAIAYWLVFKTGDRTFFAPTFVQAFGGIITIPGSVITFLIPPFNVHSGMFEQASFVANAVFYTLLTYTLSAFFGKKPNARLHT